MTQAAIIEALAEATGLSAKQVQSVLRALRRLAISQLKDVGQFRLYRFLKFSTSTRQARQGRNPRTGEAIAIPAGQYANVIVSKTFRDDLNGE
ncbi:MAG: HU family DNA-binding protein [Verrucomicrobiota bacterium]